MIKILPLVLLLSGCANMYGIAMYDHGSKPLTGRPFNKECEVTSSFIGAGVGVDYKNTSVYTALGANTTRQCITTVAGLPGVTERDKQARLIVIQKFGNNK